MREISLINLSAILKVNLENAFKNIHFSRRIIYCLICSLSFLTLTFLSFFSFIRFGFATSPNAFFKNRK